MNETDYDWQFLFETVKASLIRFKIPVPSDVALLADAANDITNGFKNFFPDEKEFKRVIFWFHMKKVQNDKMIGYEIYLL